MIKGYHKGLKLRLEKDSRKNQVKKVEILNPRKSKPIIDQIDTALAEHYGLPEAELDFIINFDIKYRMGKALFGEAYDSADED